MKIFTKIRIQASSMIRMGMFINRMCANNEIGWLWSFYNIFPFSFRGFEAIGSVLSQFDGSIAPNNM